jgi:hypothetical protein
MTETRVLLKTPTPALVREYIHKFDTGRDGRVDKALLELFRAFPQNNRMEHILFKVLGLNALYSTEIIAVQPVARHILSLNLDAKLAQGAAELVNQIARTPMKDGKVRRNYSFATKYCSWHMPAAYPIFDSVVGKLISEYQRLDRFANYTWQHELTDYLVFKQAIEAFREKYGLSDFSFKELDKFLWSYGKETLGGEASQ